MTKPSTSHQIIRDLARYESLAARAETTEERSRWQREVSSQIAAARLAYLGELGDPRRSNPEQVRAFRETIAAVRA